MSSVAQVVAPSILPSAPQGGDQVREAEVGTGLHVTRHHCESSNTPRTAHNVRLDGKVILGFRGALRIPATLANRHFAPVRTALVVVLVKGSGTVGVVHVASEGQGYRPIGLPLLIVLEQFVVEGLGT